MGDSKIGRSLVKKGLLTEKQLDDAVRAQLRGGGHLGTCLIELGLMDEAALTEALAEIYGVPSAPPDALHKIDERTIAIVPAKVADEYCVIPFRVYKKALHLAMVDPSNLPAVNALSFATGMRILPWVAPELRIFQALERYYGVPRSRRYVALCDAVDSGTAMRVVSDPAPARAAEAPPVAGVSQTAPSSMPTKPAASTTVEAFSKPVESAVSTSESAAKPVEAAVPKPIEPAITKPVEPATTKPVEPAATKPVEAAVTKPVEPTATKSAVAVNRTVDIDRQLSFDEELAANFSRNWQEVAAELHLDEPTDAVDAAPDSPWNSSWSGRGALSSLGPDLPGTANRLCRSDSKEDVADAILDYTGARMARGILFGVNRYAATPWRAKGFDNDRLPQIKLPITSGIFELLAGNELYRGVIPREERYENSYRVLGIERPAEVLLVPLYLGDRLVAVFHGDGGPQGRVSGDTDEFLLLFRLFGPTMSLLILKNKIRDAVHPPPEIRRKLQTV